MGTSIQDKNLKNFVKLKFLKIGYTKNISSSHDALSSDIILGLEIKFFDGLSQFGPPFFQNISIQEWTI